MKERLVYLDAVKDGEDHRHFVVQVEAEAARTAYQLYRQGELVRAAQALAQARVVAHEVPPEDWWNLSEEVGDLVALVPDGEKLSRPKRSWKPFEAFASLLLGGEGDSRKMSVIIFVRPEGAEEEDFRPLEPFFIAEGALRR